MNEFYGDEWLLRLARGEDPEPEGPPQQAREPSLGPATCAGAAETSLQAREPSLGPATAAGVAETSPQASEPSLAPAAAAGLLNTPRGRVAEWRLRARPLQMGLGDQDGRHPGRSHSCHIAALETIHSGRQA